MLTLGRLYLSLVAVFAQWEPDPRFSGSGWGHGRDHERAVPSLCPNAYSQQRYAGFAGNANSPTWLCGSFSESTRSNLAITTAARQGRGGRARGFSRHQGRGECQAQLLQRLLRGPGVRRRSAVRAAASSSSPCLRAARRPAGVRKRGKRIWRARKEDGRRGGREGRGRERQRRGEKEENEARRGEDVEKREEGAGKENENT
eukprot:355874-Rhodomonas_salina.1